MRRTQLCRGPIVVAIRALCFLLSVMVYGSSIAAGANLSALPPDVVKAIEASVDHLKKQAPREQEARKGLMAYALMKGGEDPQSETVSVLLKSILAKFENENYKPSQHHYYEAGCDLMALEAADPEKYRKEITTIARYIAAGQNDGGGWNYASERNSGGDTSVTQYAILGLWAAERAGVEVPRESWDRAAGWLSSSPQLPNGGFVYRPGDSSPKHSMTVAAVACLYICRKYLYPEVQKGLVTAADAPQTEQPREKEPEETPAERQKRLGIRWGVLEPIPLDLEEEVVAKKPDAQPVAADPRAGIRRTPIAKIDLAIRGGIAWLSQNFEIRNPVGWPKYYLYGLERMAALANVQRIGNHDWYDEGSQFLVSTQNPNGTWNSRNAGEAGSISSCFGILFLSQSTRELVGLPIRRFGPVAGGLLVGGRGLPDDLSQAKLKDGQVEKKQKPSGPFEELLAELAKGESQAAVQEAIVEKIRIGNPEELIGQKDRLVKLASNSDPEIRRTALWALGRTDDLAVVPLMLAALKDANVDVMVEARNALCFLSRKPQGFGLSSGPFEGMTGEETERQRTAALDRWRSSAVDRWTKWYFSVRPYADRDDLRERERKR